MSCDLGTAFFSAWVRNGMDARRSRCASGTSIETILTGAVSRQLTAPVLLACFIKQGNRNVVLCQDRRRSRYGHRRCWQDPFGWRLSPAGVHRRCGQDSSGRRLSPSRPERLTGYTAAASPGRGSGRARNAFLHTPRDGILPRRCLRAGISFETGCREAGPKMARANIPPERVDCLQSARSIFLFYCVIHTP